MVFSLDSREVFNNKFFLSYMKFLIDTCVWIDLLEDREGFGNNAARFLFWIIERKHTLVINDEIFSELRKSHIIKIVLHKFIEEVSIVHRSRTII